MAREEGPGSLWSGTGPSLLLVSNPAVKFTAYEALKRRLLAGQQQPSAGAAFLLGVASSLAATVATYPLQVVQAKARVGDAPGERSEKKSFFKAASGAPNYY